MSEENKYAPKVWGQEQFHDLEVPSGQLCQVRAPGIQQMIAAGVLESADTLTSLVDEKHIKRVNPKAKQKGPTPTKNGGSGAVAKKTEGESPEINAETLLEDPENMSRVFTLVDRVTEHMVMQPHVMRPVRFEKDDNGKQIELPLPPDERRENVIYTDQIDLMDKMYIFQYSVGGDTDLEQFRERFTEGMGSVAAQ